MTRPIPILMYHSVSDDGPGPVSLPPGTFREQLAVLADIGAQAISVSEYVSARREGRVLASGTVVLTFDDGYRDFADVVSPLLLSRGWRGTVFLPVIPVDENRPWDCGDGHARPLLTWSAVSELAAAGFEFGAHSLTHRDLRRMTPGAARDEVALAGEQIQERAGASVMGFAAPFGWTPPPLMDVIRRHYRWAVGTTMGLARDHSDLFDLPRIDMWYLRNPRHWRRFVSRGGSPYFELRRALRAMKQALS